MPREKNGRIVRRQNYTEDLQSGNPDRMKIKAEKLDQDFNDLYGMLGKVIFQDGETPMEAALNLHGFPIKNLAAARKATDALSLGRARELWNQKLGQATLGAGEHLLSVLSGIWQILWDNGDKGATLRLDRLPTSGEWLLMRRDSTSRGVVVLTSGHGLYEAGQRRETISLDAGRGFYILHEMGGKWVHVPWGDDMLLRGGNVSVYDLLTRLVDDIPRELPASQRLSLLGEHVSYLRLTSSEDVTLNVDRVGRDGTYLYVERLGSSATLSIRFIEGGTLEGHDNVHIDFLPGMASIAFYCKGTTWYQLNHAEKWTYDAARVGSALQVVGGGDKPSGASQPGTAQFPYPWLINGTMDVAQRGVRGDLRDENGYALDRWFCGPCTWQRVDTTPEKSQLRYALKLSAPGEHFTCVQSVEDGWYYLKGKTVTLSAWVKGPVGKTASLWIDGASGTPTPYAFDGTWQLVHATLHLAEDAADEHLHVHPLHGLPAGTHDVWLTGVVLQPGTEIGPLVRLPLSLDLARARRYFERLTAQEIQLDVKQDMWNVELACREEKYVSANPKVLHANIAVRKWLPNASSALAPPDQLDFSPLGDRGILAIKDRHPFDRIEGIGGYPTFRLDIETEIQPPSGNVKNRKDQ